jgi:hypothetical protein
MFINNVREAFETSVTCSFLFVRRFNRHLEDLTTASKETHINDPRLNGTKQEIVFLVSFAYSVMVINQPA